MLWRKQLDLPFAQYKPLLYKMAKDKYVDVLRKKKLRADHLQGIAFELTGDDPEERLMLQELKEHYEKALARLPEKQRVAFLMNRKEGLTYKEIAVRLDLSDKAIEKRMRLALANLKSMLNYER